MSLKGIPCPPQATLVATAPPMVGSPGGTKDNTIYNVTILASFERWHSGKWNFCKNDVVVQQSKTYRVCSSRCFDSVQCTISLM